MNTRMISVHECVICRLETFLIRHYKEQLVWTMAILPCWPKPCCWKTALVSNFRLSQMHLPRLSSTVVCFHLTTQTIPVAFILHWAKIQTQHVNMSWNKKFQKCLICTKTYFLSNFVHKCVYIPVCELFSFAKRIHPPDRCDISRSWINSMIIT